MPSEISRRRFLRDGSTGCLGLALLPALRVEAAPSFDWVLRGATVVDGTGGPLWSADLGVRGDTIAAIGSIDPAQGRRALDLSGLHLCPGFIDIHSHSDYSIRTYPGAESRILQGVTTEITGNCGASAAPLDGVDAARRRREFFEQEGIEPDWTSVASYLERLERGGIAANQALLLGQGTLRENAIGNLDRPLSSEGLRGVLRALEQGLDEGAIGLSTGLEYTPGSYTPTEEIVALARVVARYGGLYASHIRNEEAMLLEAVHEAIDIGRQTACRVEISHLKAAGRPNWSKQGAALDLIEDGRGDGIEVLADAYPYTAYSTGLTIFLDPPDREGGPAELVQRLRDPARRATLRSALPQRLERDPGGPELVVIASVAGERNRELVGKNLAEIGLHWKIDPAEALLRLLEEEQGAVSFIGHGMSAENVELVLRHPLVMIGSDGSSMAPVGLAAQQRPHPRSYGAFARVLGRFAREQKLLDLPAAVRKMTSMPADQAGLRGRGRIARGAKADLVAFSAAEVRDRADFDAPHQYATGIANVWVGGVLAVESGKPTAARPGRVLRPNY